MKIKLTESQLAKLVKIVIKENKSNIFSQLIGEYTDKIIKNLGEDIVSQIEDIIGNALSNEINVGIDENGNQVLKSMSGSTLKLEDLRKIIRDVGMGKSDAQINALPRILMDGTEFRKNFINVIANKKPIVPKNEMSLEEQKIFNMLMEFTNWYQIGDFDKNHSGWKFHIYANSVEDSAFLFVRLKPIAKKWGAILKTASQANYDALAENPYQIGKGVVFYIPSYVIKDNKQRALLNEINSAISDYDNAGDIDGDLMLTKNIGIRYELNKPINPKVGLDLSTDQGFNDYKYNWYKSQEGGSSYNVPNNPDIFLDL
jgi:hypothetical protein